jgi:MFS family permease
MRFSDIRFAYHWRIVTASFLVNALATGVYFLGITVFFLPISRDFGVSRAAASMPFTLARIVSAINSPLTGFAIDRLGPAKVMLIGGALAGLGFVLLKWSPGYAFFVVVFVLLLTTGIQSGFDAPATAVVSNWFVRKRGMAFAISSSGFAFGGAAFTPLVAVAVHLMGWRDAALLLGCIVWAVIVPVALVIRKKPPLEVARSSPTPAQPAASVAVAEPATDSETDYNLKQALRTRVFWLLSFSYGIRGAVWAGLSVHLVAMMVWKGVDEREAGLLLGVYPLLWIPSTLVMGWMADRWPKQRIAGIAVVIGAFGLLLMVMWGQVSMWGFVLIFFLLSPNEGTWPIAWALITEHFGRKNFGSLRGSVLAFLSVMGVGVPMYAGWVFDSTGSYNMLLMPAVILLLISGYLTWIMPMPRSRAAPRAPVIPGGVVPAPGTGD